MTLTLLFFFRYSRLSTDTPLEGDRSVEDEDSPETDLEYLGANLGRDQGNGNSWPN